MPRDTSGDSHRSHIEHRDPRMAHRPHDEDVRIDRRDRDIYDGLPSVTNRNFSPVSQGDGFGYAGQGGYGDNVEQQGYKGVGPTDRWRTDARIEELLHVHLTDADSINATAVIVAVSEGNVTLNGWVPERKMKHEAEELAWNIAGVKDVTNRITIGESPDALGKPGEAMRSGGDQQGSGFSSSQRVDISDTALGDEDEDATGNDRTNGRT
ncbi:Periplasmic lipoprotein [Lysobacter dokdonensis DS-58]|uniref:Periplasmic lipoprotein n=1 Tax=Lysobacter dokdonensis DS-58 TaxID=1300345 RepID=A0A0A2X4Q2_9GAMM|nr:BON domain-containing protein [Lysobacter dokdonensis]KGQ20179.1 Periplasmic lipoprotein [Lysobacter dokdonensis DS-58]